MSKLINAEPVLDTVEGFRRSKSVFAALELGGGDRLYRFSARFSRRRGFGEIRTLETGSGADALIVAKG